MDTYIHIYIYIYVYEPSVVDGIQSDCRLGFFLFYRGLLLCYARTAVDGSHISPKSGRCVAVVLHIQCHKLNVFLLDDAN